MQSQAILGGKGLNAHTIIGNDGPIHTSCPDVSKTRKKTKIPLQTLKNNYNFYLTHKGQVDHSGQ